MDLALWIAAGVLAAISLGAGLNKLIFPREKLMAKPSLAWAEEFTQGQLRLIALAELAGAVGLVLPLALDVLPLLTPLAACGIAALQLGALRTHAQRGEKPVLVLNVVLIAAAVFVAVGRFAGWGE